ncbi:unnamed protein product [Musa acuminata subsp. burmannicoides]
MEESMNRSLRRPAPGRTLTKETDEELALFIEMRKLEKERRDLRLHSTGELDPPLGSKPGSAPKFRIGASAPARKAGIDDFLNSNNGKNDYDWLLTPPGTPLFLSLDTDSKRSPTRENGIPKARPTVLRSRLANAPNPSRNLLASRQPPSYSVLNSSAAATRRPSSSGGPTHGVSRPATPTGSPALPAVSKPARPSTPTSRATLPSRSSAPPSRSSTPVRSSTPTARPSVSAANKPASRSTTPTRRPSAPSTAPVSSAPPRRSSSVTRSGSTISRSSAPPCGSSPTIKPRPLKPSDIPGFSLDTPPNLRTSLSERPSSASRGRPGGPSSRSSSVEPGPNVRPRRQSCSPSRGRVSNGNAHKGGSVQAPSRRQARDSDNSNPVVLGNRMVERTANVRRLAPPKQDNQRLTNDNLSGKTCVSPDSTGFGRSLSKQSLDMAFRHMDIRRSIPNSLRPLMANIPASSVYSVRSGSTRSRTVSASGSPLTTSSTTSSEQSVNNNMTCLGRNEIEDDLTIQKQLPVSHCVNIVPSKNRMAASEISPAPSDAKSKVWSTAAALRGHDASAIAAYENYLRLPELAKLWSSNDFPRWTNESILKPALQGLEITFRFVSLALSDPRPYANHREWKRRLESLAARQVEIIATLCEEEGRAGGGAPIADLSSCQGLLSRGKSSQEVWKVPGTSSVVSRTSEASLLPRLATWEKSEDVASKILFQIESQMHRCQFTLGLGEPNLTGKPTLEYDLVVRPSDLHALKRSPGSSKDLHNHEDQALCTIQQILESWLFAARELLARVDQRMDDKDWAQAANDCWLLERVWKLLSDVEDLHLLMDPDDFLRLKSQLAIKATSGSEAFCFRSAALLQVTNSCKDLKRRVPWILGVEADPNGGPRVQDAAMRLFHSRRRGEGDNPGKIDLLQALQAVEVALKTFFFAYRHLVATVMGSLEASGNRAVYTPSEALDPLSQVFLEPPYYPSLDAAKTFLGDFWQNELGSGASKTKWH